MKYINVHLTESEYKEFLLTNIYWPHVDYTQDDLVSHFDPEKPENKWLTFTALEDCVLSLTNYGYNTPSLEYSIDDGVHWYTWDYTPFHLSPYASVAIRGTNPYGVCSSDEMYSTFSCTGQYTCTGNIAYLLNTEEALDEIPSEYCFYKLFAGSSTLISGPELRPSIIKAHCYESLFEGCSSMITAPSLPATKTAEACYKALFKGCSSITSYGKLPAKKVDVSAYESMFEDCTGLETAPVLRATSVSNSSCKRMFAGCNNPLFTNAPELLPSTLVTDCYREMFYNCSNLNWMKVQAINISPYVHGSALFTEDWLYGVASEGDFYRHVSENDWLIDDPSGIPVNWEEHPPLYLKFILDTTTNVTGTVKYSNFGGNTVVLDYSTDRGRTWTTNWQPDTPITYSDRLYVRGLNYAGFSRSLTKYSQFATTGNCSVSGTLQSLIAYNEYQYTAFEYSFVNCFKGCSSITNAEKLTFDVTKVKDYAYYHCFDGTGIANIPEFPETLLSRSCYEGMFANCEGLTAITRATVSESRPVQACFKDMFAGCTNLESVPSTFLPADSLATSCYEGMFRQCEALLVSPELNALSLAPSCYQNMFCDCTSLVITPDLPAAVLVESCYATMFQGCNALTTIQAETLQFTKAAQLSCFRMFFNCEGFIDLSDVTLPCTSLAAECYEGMFSTSSNLQKAPLLPAPTLVNKCYEAMFSGCTSLIQAPVLAATRAADSCYKNMFYNCTALVDPPTLGLQFTAAYCCDHMFYNCTSLKKSPYLAPETLINGCYQYMFQKCSSLEYITCKAKNNYGIGYEANTLNWMSECKNGGTFERVQTSHNWSCGVSNVKETWTVTPHLYCAIGTQVKTGNADYVATASKLFKFKKYDNPTFSINFQYSIDGGTWTDGVIETEYSFTKSIAFRGINMDGLMQQGVGYATTHTGLQLWGDLRGMCEYTQEVIELASTARYMPFIYMFGNNATLENIDYFHAYFTKLRSGQYSSMFVRATALTSVPSTLFPAETTAYSSGAYRSLFSGCSAITSIPDDIFRNKESHFGQYEYMFLNCVKLVLPTTLHFHTGITDAGQNEYSHCFDGCSAITSIPDDLFTLHTTLASNCYEYMFYGCGITSLNAVLPSTTLATKCYFHMFENCKSLTSINQLMLPASTFNQTHSYMYAYMFAGCIKLSTFTSDLLPSSRMSTGCYSHMFQGCNALTDLSGVAFPCHSTESNCYEYMFQGCTGLTHTPAISISAVTEEVAYAATNTSQYACQYMFANCSKLNHPERIQISTTPGTWMCYRMFQGCNALTTNVPYLRFANCNESCCEEMFQGCGLLSKIVDLNTQVNHATNCYKHMYKDCLSLVDLTAHTISGTKPATYSCRGMFKGCTGLKKSPTFSMSTLKNGVTNTQCYAELFYNCIILEYINCQAVEGIKFSENNCDDWTYGITIANGTFERAQTASDWIMNPEPTNTTTPDAVPFNWSVTPPLWICFSSPGSNASVSWSFTRSGTPAGVNFSYTTGGDWATAAAETTYSGTNYILVHGYNTGGVSKSNSDYVKFITSATTVSGMLSSLINTMDTVTDVPNTYCFSNLFNGCSTITTTENLHLDCTTLNDYCYRSIFLNCSGLTKLPDISTITSTATGAFQQAMQGCTGLLTIPSTYLEHLEIKNNIFYNMFYGCNKLTTLPNLPSTTLADHCYRAMFYGCTSLVDISSFIIPASEAKQYCCYQMFAACNKIATLNMNMLSSVTKLASYCYGYLFDGCSSITDAKSFSLPASEMQPNCYSYMFRSTKLANDKLPTLSSKTMATGCYGGMFESVSTLTDISATFSLPTGITLADTCFGAMFYGCGNLVSVNADLLKDYTTLEPSCYHYMFSGCSKLTTVLNLPATTMKENCYYRMFNNCPALTTCPTLPANVLAKGCYREMFRGCSGLLSDSTHKEPTLNATVLYPQCYYQMFYGCTKLTAATVMATTSYEHTSTVDCPTYQMFYNISTEGILSTNYDHVYDWDYRDLYGKLPLKWETNEDLIIIPADTSTTITFTPRVSTYKFKWRKASSSSYEWSAEQTGGSISFNERVHIKGMSGSPCQFNTTSGCFGTDKTKKFTAKGHVRGLAKLSSATDTPPTYLAYYLFHNSGLTDTSSLVLPKVTSEGCCMHMCLSCTNLTAASVKFENTAFTKYCFRGIWESCSGITTAASIVLPGTSSTALAEGCFMSLFMGCTVLDTLPNLASFLPYTTLASNCYDHMFCNCQKITSLPKLPATTMQKECYKQMFYGCTALTTITSGYFNISSGNNLANSCFNEMFQSCTSLTSAANIKFLSGTFTMRFDCFCEMFYGCTKLATGPTCADGYLKYKFVSDHDASTVFYRMFRNTKITTWNMSNEAGTAPAVAHYTYAEMFYGCTALTSVKIDNLAVDASRAVGNHGCDCMFYGCTALTSVTYNASAQGNSWKNLYAGNNNEAECAFSGMFEGCTALTTIGASGNTINILGGVAGKLMCNHMFHSCKVLVFKIGNITIGTDAYERMFDCFCYQCEKLTQSGNISVTKSATQSHYYMYYGCKGITTVQITPINSNGGQIGEQAFESMFQGCEGVTSFANLTHADSTISNRCFYAMFRYCRALTTIPGCFYGKTHTLDKPTGYSDPTYCYAYMFEDNSRMAGVWMTSTNNSSTYTMGSANKGMFLCHCNGCSSLGEWKNYGTIFSAGCEAPYDFAHDAWKNCSSMGSFNYSAASSVGNFRITANSGQAFYAAWYNCSSCYFSNGAATISCTMSTDGNCPANTFNSAFYNCTKVTRCPITNIGQFSNMGHQGMRQMFDNCTSMTTVPKFTVGRQETSSDITLHGTNTYSHYRMFYNCVKLTDIASNLDFADYIHVYKYTFWGMFYNCTGITAPPNRCTNDWDFYPHGEAGMAFMFYNCYSMAGTLYIYLSTNNTKLTSIPAYFFESWAQYCSNITTIKAYVGTRSYFTSIGTKAFYNMYQGCTRASSGSWEFYFPQCTSFGSYCYAYTFAQCYVYDGTIYYYGPDPSSSNYTLEHFLWDVSMKTGTKMTMYVKSGANQSQWTMPSSGWPAWSPGYCVDRSNWNASL